MKFVISRTSQEWDDESASGAGAYRDQNNSDRWLIEFSSIEDLVTFVSGHGGKIVLSIRHDESPSIEIYDDFRE